MAFLRLACQSFLLSFTWYALISKHVYFDSKKAFIDYVSGLFLLITGLSVPNSFVFCFGYQLNTFGVYKKDSTSGQNLFRESKGFMESFNWELGKPCIVQIIVFFQIP